MVNSGFRYRDLEDRVNYIRLRFDNFFLSRYREVECLAVNVDINILIFSEIGLSCLHK